MSFRSLMNKKMAVMEKAETEDGAGGFTEKLTATDVKHHPCRIRAKSGDERPMSGSTGVAVSHRIYCTPTTVDESNIIHLDCDTTVDYLVQFVNRELYIRNVHHYQIDVLERRRNV